MRKIVALRDGGMGRVGVTSWPRCSEQRIRQRRDAFADESGWLLRRRWRGEAPRVASRRVATRVYG